MKRSLWIVAALVVSLAAQARPTSIPAAPPAHSPPKALPPISATVKKEKVDIFTPIKLRSPAPTDKVYRVDGMSSQPWARIAGSHPGWSEFPRPETANRGLDIFSLSFR
jgi:hypothetical protein